jgi:hypothetical protein
VFHSKSRTEQLQDTSASLAGSASTVAEQLRERVVPAVGQAAGSAKQWAKPRVEHGIEVAAPKLESVVTGLAPKVDTARDKIVDELLPRLTEAINAFAAASAAAKDEAMTRGAGAAAVISGEAVAAPKRTRKGRVLLILGLLGAAAAGAAAFMKKSAPKDDPWATPLAEPYVSPSTGRHSGVASVPDTTDATSPKPTQGKPELIESLDDSSASDSVDPLADGDAAAKDNKAKGPSS